MNDYQVLGVSENCNIVEVDFKYQEELKKIYEKLNDIDGCNLYLYYRMFSLYKAYNNIVLEQRSNPIKKEINNFVIYNCLYEIISDIIDFLNFMAFSELTGNSQALNKLRDILTYIISYIDNVMDKLRGAKSKSDVEIITNLYLESLDNLLLRFKKSFLLIIDEMFPNIDCTMECQELIRELRNLSSFNVIPLFLNRNIDIIGDIIVTDIILKEENDYLDIKEEDMKIKEDYDNILRKYILLNNMDIDEYMEICGNNRYSNGLRKYFKDKGIDNDMPLL